MQSISINTAKIDKNALYQGTKGKYLNITLLENRDGTDQYGNDGFVVQDIGKERREAGERGEILGNWKHIKARNAPQTQPAAKQTAAGGPSSTSEKWDDQDEDDDIPF